MPAPNHDNPLCPCCSMPMSKNGKSASGVQQYRCRREGCGKTKVDSDRKVGRPAIKAVKLTPKEKEERWKQNDPKGYREACDRRNTKAREKYAERKKKE